MQCQPQCQRNIMKKNSSWTGFGFSSGSSELRKLVLPGFSRDERREDRWLRMPWQRSKKPAKCLDWFSSRSSSAGRHFFSWIYSSLPAPSARCRYTWSTRASGLVTCPPLSIRWSTRSSTERSGLRSSDCWSASVQGEWKLFRDYFRWSKLSIELARTPGERILYRVVY